MKEWNGSVDTPLSNTSAEVHIRKLSSIAYTYTITHPSFRFFRRDQSVHSVLNVPARAAAAEYTVTTQTTAATTANTVLISASKTAGSDARCRN